MWSRIPLFLLLATLATGCCKRGATKPSATPLTPVPTTTSTASLPEPSPCLLYQVGGRAPEPSPVILGIPQCPADMPAADCPPLDDAQESALWVYVADLEARNRKLQRYADRAWRACGEGQAAP